MTYLFKLARRLAFGNSVLIASLAVLACSDAEPRDFLAPEPGTPSPNNVPVSLHIAAHSGAVAHEGFMRFSAWGRNAGGDSIAVHVSWAASGGEIGADGTFKATAPGQQTITAFATSRPSVKASTTVMVGESGPIFTGLKIYPEPVAVFGGNTVNFTATAKLTVNGATTAPAVTWTTTGGSIDAQGRFTATTVPGDYLVTARTVDGKLTATAPVKVKADELVQLTLFPKATVIAGGEYQDFYINAAWSNGASDMPVIEWQTEAGTIVPIPAGAGPMGSPGNGNGNAAGRLEAGTSPGNHKVIAKHPHSGKADTATVTILPTLAEITVTPREVDLVPGASATFAVSGTMTDGASIVVTTPSWSATGGTISGAGVYKAGPQAGTFRVVATTADGKLADTVAVRISQPVATLTQLAISPRSGTVATGAGFQFSATATWSNGSTALPALTWSADAGTITADGRWTAPASAGTVRVRVADAAGTRADTAVMTVQVPEPTLTSLSIAPGTADLTSGQSVTFSPSATWSNGGTTVPSLAWSATGGTVTQAGKWTAPVNHPGTYKVVARHSGGTLADTATIQVASVPQVTSINVSPSVAATVPQGTVQFAATATWSDGQQRAVEFIWQATGGSINMNGLFTAGSIAGQFLVIASCTGCPVADTVGVSITEPVQQAPVVLTQLVLNPSSFTLETGQTRTLTLGATWSDGSTTVPNVTWSATGGTMSGLVYTAGQTAGSYRIIARHQGGTLADTTTVTVQAPEAPPPPPPPPPASSGDLVVFPTEAIGFIIGPQLKVGAAANPWSWYDQNATARGLVHGAAFPATAPTSNLDAYINQNYYDLGLTLYTAFYRTGDTRFRDYARKVADSWWTVGQIKSGTANPENSFAPRNVSLGGLMLRAMDGRPEMWPWIVSYTRSQYQIWLGARLNNPSLHYGVRDGGYMLLYAAWLAKAHPDPAIRAEFLTKARDAAKVYYARLQQPDGGWYWQIPEANNQEASQPFMIGLLLDGLIATHQLSPDPEVANAIVKGAEWVYLRGYQQHSPTNLSSVKWRSMRYFVVKSDYQAYTSTTALLYGSQDGAIRDQRQLNATTVHAFGYAYKLTGDPAYLAYGDDIFAATFGKGQGPGSDAYYGLADFREKEYNQSYRSAGRYLAWRLGN